MAAAVQRPVHLADSTTVAAETHRLVVVQESRRSPAGAVAEPRRPPVGAVAEPRRSPVGAVAERHRQEE